MLNNPILFRRNFVAAGVLLIALVPLFLSPYYIFVANLILIYIILAIGLNIVLGYAGQLSFSNGAIFGIGAYATGLLRLDYGCPYWLALPLGALTATVLGILVALPALRLKGHYLALASIAFAQSTIWILVHWDGLTHGTSGFVLEPVEFSLIGLNSHAGMLYLSLAAAIVCVVMASNILQSPVGRAFVAIRESEHAASALAIDLTRYKIYAYGISSLYAGVAGGLFVGVVGAVVPDQFGLFQIVLQFCMVFVGGVGSLWGSVVGAVLIISSQELMRGFQQYQEFGFGVLLLVIIIFFPSGIVGFLKLRVGGWQEPLRHYFKARG